MNQTCQHIQFIFHLNHLSDLLYDGSGSLKRLLLMGVITLKELSTFVSVKDPTISLTLTNMLTLLWHFSFFVNFDAILLNQHFHVILDFLSFCHFFL